MNYKPPDEKDLNRAFELFKIEYQQAADRFENIYKAMWQIFYYMSVLAAGILTFGSRSLTTEVTILTAISPLLFWFLAIYIPMNSYGQNTRNRLKEIEIAANEKFSQIWEMQHYHGFATIKPPWRTGGVIWVFGLIISCVWLLTLTIVIAQHFNPNQNATIPQKYTQVQQLNAKIDSLEQKIDLLLKASQNP